MAHGKQRILIVDDDALMREVLALTLAAPGRAVVTAESGDHAIASIVAAVSSAVPFTAVLTDIQMPGLSGGALAARLRQLSPALLISMSGSDCPDDVRSAFDAFLHKPFTTEQFAAVLHTLQLASAPARTDAAQPANDDALDEATFRKLSAMMPRSKLDELFELCLADSERRLSRMSAAAAAGDAATYTAEAHAIKGGCGMLGARRLHALASEMETGALQSTPLLAEFERASLQLRRILSAHT